MAKMDEILGLEAKTGLRTVVALSLGYRSANDSNATRPEISFTVRRSRDGPLSGLGDAHFCHFEAK